MKRALALIAPLLILGACDAEVQLEQTPGAISAANCLVEPTLTPSQSASGPWGNAAGDSNDGVNYTVNEGYSVAFCIRGGNRYSSLVVTGQQGGTSGFMPGPENPGEQTVLAEWSATQTGGPTTTTAADTTTTAAETTTTAGSTTAPDEGTTTTIESETTLTQGGVSTTTAGGDTTTTTIGDVTITTDPGASTTAAEGATTVTEGGGAGDPTTTVEVGAGGLTTTQEGEGEGTLDTSQETSTSGDEVAGASDESLPHTGAGQVSLGGLGGLLLGAGVILLLLVRRRSRED